MFLTKRVLTLVLGILMVLGLTNIALANGTITGTVSDGTTAISGINVWADGSGVGTLTNPDGSYSLSVPAGSYRIGAGGSNGYVTEYYNEKPYWNDADIIIVNDDQTLTGIDFTLDPGVTISGHVYIQGSATSIPNENITVALASSEHGSESYGARTDTAGYYSIVVPYGDWKVRAGGNTIYAPEYYNQKSSRDTADIVTVSATQNAPNIDFTLELGGTVSGRITDESGNPINNVEISYDNDGKDAWRNTYSNPDGTYLLQGLPEGIADVTVRPAVNSGYAWPIEKDIYLTLGENKTNIDFVLKQGFLVFGYTKDPSPVPIPIPNININADSALYGCRIDTDSNGYYAMRLPAGTYGMSIWDDNGQYVALPNILTITGDTSNVDFTVYTSATGGATIAGTITNSVVPLLNSVTSEFGVVAFQAGATFDIDNFDLIVSVSEGNVATAGGEYSLLVPPGQNYDIHFFSQNETADGIESVTVRGSEFNVLAGSTKDFIYTSVGGTVTGAVTYDGEPVLMAEVILSDSDGNFAGFADTDQDGVYSFYNVPADDYTVQAKNSEGVKTGKVSVIVTGTETVTKNISYASIPPMVTGDINGDDIDELVVNFGESYGIWIRYADSSWSQLHNLSPKSMVAANVDGDAENKKDLVIDFGDQYGIWIYYNNSEWQQLHNLSVEQIVTADLDRNGQKDIIVDFGPQYGIWIYYNNSTWAQLHNISPKSMVEADLDDDFRIDLIIDFGSQYGIWIYYNNSTWTQLHNLSADSIVANDLDLDPDSHEDIVVDFGDAYGIWIYYNNSTWAQLHNLSPVSMALGRIDDSDLYNIIADFGPSYGIWVYSNNSTWSQLHNLSADSIVTGDLNGNGKSEIIIDFGEPYGIWVYNDDGTWWQLHNLSP